MGREFFVGSAFRKLSSAQQFFNISNDVRRVKELLRLDLAVSRTPFLSTQAHWFASRE